MTLNERQFFHASKRNLTPGVDQILPSNDTRVGGSHYGYSKHDNWRGGWEDDEDRGDYTFAADTEEEAEAWSPSGRGRPTTYVVDPGEDYETESHHYVTHQNPEDRGIHAKVRGPMEIIDRIDIPRPQQPGHYVQGTLPPENWARHSTEYDQYANYKDIAPAYEAHQRERAEVQAEFDVEDERVGYEARWKAAGQQELNLFPGEALGERAREIKRKAMQRGTPRSGNVQPYLPFE